jgi:hypothetical protein
VRSKAEIVMLFCTNPALGNVNDATLSNSKYGDKNRFISFKKNGDMVMTNGLLLFLHFFSMHKEVSTILMVEILYDGASGNDLIYIPTTAEISTMIFSGAGQGAAFDNSLVKMIT